MDVPEGHLVGTDLIAFLEGVRPHIDRKLIGEALALNSVKFQLALKVQLRKDAPDGSEEYTDPVLRHKLEALLQASEIDEALGHFPLYWRRSRNGHREAPDGCLKEIKHSG